MVSVGVSQHGAREGRGRKHGCTLAGHTFVAGPVASSTGRLARTLQAGHDSSRLTPLLEGLRRTLFPTLRSSSQLGQVDFGPDHVGLESCVDDWSVESGLH